MSNDLDKKYILTIDANIFHSNGYNFGSPNISELEKIKNRGIKIVLSDVVYHEMIKHFSIQRKLDEQINQLNKSVEFSRQFSIFSENLINSIQKELENCKSIDISEKEIIDFCKKYDIEIIATFKYIDMQSILDMYVKSIAPFEKNNKKSSEFQDALTLVGLEKWVKQNNYEILAITNDKGWKSYSENSDYITTFESISTVLEYLLYLENKQRELEILKEKFLQFISKNDEQFSECIQSDIEGYGLSVLADSHYYYEVDDNYIEYINQTIENDKINITEINKEYFDVSVSINVDYEAKAHFSFYIRDSIDGDYVGIGSGHEAVEVNDDFDFLVRLYLDENQEIQEFEILNSINYSSSLEVDFGYVERDSDYYYEE